MVSADLRAYNALDYKKAETIMGIGYQAAESKGRVLLPYALDEASWQQYVQQRAARERHRLPTPQFAKVEGTNPTAARHLEKFLQPMIGKPLDTALLSTMLLRLTGTFRYDSAAYRMTNVEGQDGLIVTIHEKNNAPPILQLGFSVDGSESNDVNFTQLARLTFTDIAGYRSE